MPQQIVIPVPTKQGGTGADLSATGGTGNVLHQLSAGAAVTVGLATNADVASVTVLSGMALSYAGGVLTVSGSLKLATSGSFVFDVNGNSIGDNANPIYDQTNGGTIWYPAVSFPLADAGALYDPVGNTIVNSAQQWGFFGSVPIYQPSGDVATALVNLGLITSPTIAVTPSASATLTGQSAAGNITSYTPGATGTYRIGAWATITAVTLDVLKLQVTYTDETSTSRSVDLFPQGTTSVSLATTGVYTFPCIDIRVKISTAITVKSVLTTATGSLNFDAGASINFVNS